MALTEITTKSIKDGEVTNADIHSSAAIATSKLSGAVSSISSHGLAASATTDTTNAANIGSGTLPAARIGDDSIVEAKLDIHNAPSGTDKFLGYTSNGMEWATPGGGKILQYQHAAANTTTETYGTTWIDTVCTDTITTTKLNSKIWVTATFTIFHMKDTNDSRGGTRLRRDEGGADEFVDGSSKGMYYRKDGNDANQNNNCRFQYKSHHSWIDSPGKSAGTSITYDLQIAAQSTASNQYINISMWDIQLWELDV